MLLRKLAAYIILLYYYIAWWRYGSLHADGNAQYCVKIMKRFYFVWNVRTVYENFGYLFSCFYLVGPEPLFY